MKNISCNYTNVHLKHGKLIFLLFIIDNHYVYIYNIELLLDKIQEATIISLRN